MTCKFFIRRGSPEKWAFDNLRERVLYFGAPRNFNDPYDVGVPLSIGGLTDEQYRRGLEAKKIASTKSKEEFVKAANLLFEEEQITLRNLHGVTCFCEEHDNLLMWSHYAGGGRGFCLGFDTNHKTHLSDNVDFTTNRPKRVEYKHVIPQKNAFDMWINGTEKSYEELFSRKANSWKYEKEWRMFHSEVREYKYDEEMLKCVFLGTEAEKSTIELVRAIVIKNYHRNVQILQGRLSKSKFKVEFSPIHRTLRR